MLEIILLKQYTYSIYSILLFTLDTHISKYITFKKKNKNNKYKIVIEFITLLHIYLICISYKNNKVKKLKKVKNIEHDKITVYPHKCYDSIYYISFWM